MTVERPKVCPEPQNRNPRRRHRLVRSIVKLRGDAMGAWEGHAELQQALKGLASAKGTSATRVKAVANAAFKYVKVRE